MPWTLNPFSGKLDYYSDLSGYVPYVGATADVNLGIYSLTANNLFASTRFEAAGATGTIITYNNIATEGAGVPFIVDSVLLTEQIADIGPINFTGGSVTGGLYRVNCYLMTGVTDPGAGTVTLHILWNDGAAARDNAICAISLTSLDYNQGIMFAYLGSGSIQYETTHTGLFEDAQFDLYIELERLL